MRFFLILFFFLFIPITLFGQIPDHWASKSSDGFTERSGANSVAINGKIYVFGGSKNSVIGGVVVYDPIKNTWDTVHTIGDYNYFPRYFATSSLVNSKVYIIGGQGAISSIGKVNIFDTLTNTWSIPRTFGRFFHVNLHTSSVVNGKIYVIGNSDSSGITFQVFDPATNLWSIPVTNGSFTLHGSATSAVVGNLIYLIQSTTSTGGPTTVDVFDPSTNTWSHLPTTGGGFTQDAASSSSVVIDNKIYVVAGISRGQVSNIVYVFDPSTNSWSAPMLTGTYTPRYLMSIAALNNTIYIMGGQDTTTNQVTNINEALEPTLKSTITNAVFDTSFLCADQVRNIVVTNPNDFVVNVTDVALSGANASDFHVATPFPLIPPNGTANIEVRYTPSSVGLATATAKVSLDLPTGFTEDLPLSAYGDQVRIKFEAGNTHVLPGEEILFPIYAKSPIEKFNSSTFILTVNYDPSHLEAYDYMQDNTLTSGGDYTLNADSVGSLQLLYQTPDNSAVSGGSDSETMPLVYIKFHSHLNSGESPSRFHKDYPIQYHINFDRSPVSPICLGASTPDGNISLDSTCENISLLHDTLLFPSESYIEPIRPNPVFNGHASFTFYVPKEGVVKLDMIDMLGNTVSVLEETRKPGTYSVNWDASKCNAGMYYVRLQTDGQVKIREMVVVK